MTRTNWLVFSVSLLLLAGCASVPTGPSIMALPGSGKTFDQFRNDDIQCRQYAQYQIGGKSSDQAAAEAELRSAAVGTVVGAIAGAAIGGRDSAGVGAGTGLIMGSMAGVGSAEGASMATQKNYDNAYIQCMYGKGEQVPIPGNLNSYRNRIQSGPTENSAQPSASGYPPPPPPPAITPAR